MIITNYLKKSYFFTAFIFLCNQLSAQTTVNVTTSAELVTALNNAVPGQTILLTEASYILSSGFKAPSGVNGTENSPIIIKSTINSIISTGDILKGYALYLPNNNYWIIDGLQITNSKKGIMLDNSNYNVIKNVLVNNIGEEGIHLRTFSTYNTIQNCFIDYTGLTTPGYGEAIYIGSAKSNWINYTGGQMDKCDYNVVEFNSFGDHVAAENIDIKEGTQYGVIRGNIFNGKGLTNANFANCWVDVKGNYYTLECNTGTNSMTDGIETTVSYDGYGCYNTFRNNSFNVGNNNGYAISVRSSSNGMAVGNIICDSNTFTNAKALTNGTATQCDVTPCSTLSVAANTINPINQYSFFPNPVINQLTINSISGFKNATVVIYDETGKEVKRVANSNSDTTIVINRNDMNSGIYFVTITEEKRILAKHKIILK